METFVVVIWVIAAVVSLVVFIWFLATLSAILTTLREIRDQTTYTGQLLDYIASNDFFTETDSEPTATEASQAG